MCIVALHKCDSMYYEAYNYASSLYGQLNAVSGQSIFGRSNQYLDKVFQLSGSSPKTLSHVIPLPMSSKIC